MALDVLVIDDEKDIRELVSAILDDEGFSSRIAASSLEAINKIQEKKPDLVILDVWLNDSRFDGIQLLDVIHEQQADIPVIMVSGHGTIEMAVKTLRRGAYDFLEKPFTADRLINAAKKALEYSVLRKENETLKEKERKEKHLEGRSESIQNIQKFVEKVAPTNSRVFISGPVGSGKEFLARSIHNKSLKKDGVFLQYNCAWKEDKQVEREVFGESFSPGSNKGKVGVLERASNGTLYLNNVLDMPLSIQTKLVRALHDNYFYRVGGSSKIPLNIRLISSSCQDPKEVIKKKLFREDLYYRLAVDSIVAPSLSQRKEDIPYLVEAFLKRACDSYNIPNYKCTDGTLEILKSFNWLGNIKQLYCALEWAIFKAIPTKETFIHPDFLPLEIRPSNQEKTTELSTNREKESTNHCWEEDLEKLGVWAMPLREARELFEKQYLKVQVQRFKGNISRTSSFVGMERSALHRKLKTLKIHKVDKE